MHTKKTAVELLPAIFIIKIFSFLYLFSPQISEGYDIHDNETWTRNGSTNPTTHQSFYDNSTHTFKITQDIIVQRETTSDPTPVLKINVSAGPVTIKFQSQKKIQIGNFAWPNYYYGAIDARGTLSDKIIFTALDPPSSPNITDQQNHYWKAVLFNQTAIAAKTKLKHCIFEYGGYTSSTTDNNTGNVVIDEHCTAFSDTNPIDNCTFRNSYRDGIYVHTAKDSMRDCTFNSNKKNGVNALNILNTDSYHYYVKSDNCTLEGNGTNGVNFVQTGVAEINNSTIKQNAGYGIRLDRSGCAIENNEISNNSYGLYCVSGSDTPDIQHNTFRNNGDIPVRTTAARPPKSDNTFDNSTKAIEILTSVLNDSTLSSNNVTWPNFNIPYIVLNTAGSSIAIGGGSSSNKTLTIERGTTIRFESGVSIDLDWNNTSGYTSKLIAEGTKDLPITFTTNTTGQYWNGINFNWRSDTVNSRLTNCIIEYAGNGSTEQVGNIVFHDSAPGDNNTIKYSTIRNSKTNGIWLHTGSAHTISNCNFYGNSLYDINSEYNQFVNARLNYWGTALGPFSDGCSGAAITCGSGNGTSCFELTPWLEEPFTAPFSFALAGASKTSFNPITDSTTISFTLSQSANWTLEILNEQLDRLWSATGTGSSGSQSWNGIGDYGAVSGTCYYRISADNGTALAARAMGMLQLGDQTIAKLSSPTSGSLFAPGAAIQINGTVNGPSYQLSYGEGGIRVTH